MSHRSRHAARPLARPLGVVVTTGTIGALLLLASAATAGGEKEKRLSSREEARLELGRRLFFDPRVSRAGMRSCADCHDPEHGYSDRRAKSLDDRGVTRRHSQTLVDGVDNPSAHWDGVFSRVGDLVTARVNLSQRGRFSNGHEFAAQVSKLQGAGPGGGLDRTGGARAEPPQVEPPKVPSPGMGEYDGSAPAASEPPAETPPPSDGGGDYKAPSSAGGEREPSAAAPESPTTPSDPQPATGSAPAPAPSGSGAPAPKGPDAKPAAGAAGAAPTPKEPEKPRDPFADPFAPPTDGEENLAFLDNELETAELPLADQVLESAGRYREAFAAAFGTPQVTIKRIADAIEAYCHSIRTGEAPYDRFVAGDGKALPDAAQRGRELFEGRAGCAACHVTTGKRAPFTDYAFHNTGITWRSIDATGTMTPVERVAVADREADLGVADVTGRAKLRRAFKTPTLRDVARRGPFMHDGSLATLDAVVRHYEKGTTDPQADPRMPKFTLTNAERADLVAFLRSLSSAERPGLASSEWKERAGTIRLRVVDAAGKPLPLMRLKVIPAGDRLPGADPKDADGWVAMTDESGVVTFEPPLWTHVRLLLADGVEPFAGSMVPDTCRDATIVVPVQGKVRMLVTMPKGVAAPTAVVAEYVEAKIFPDRRRPRSILRRESSLVVGEKEVAVYTAPFRTDLPPRVSVRLPVPAWGMERLRATLDPREEYRLDLSR